MQDRGFRLPRICLPRTPRNEGSRRLLSRSARPTSSCSRSGRGLYAKDVDRDAPVAIVGHHLRSRGLPDVVAYGADRLQRHGDGLGRRVRIDLWVAVDDPSCAGALDAYGLKLRAVGLAREGVHAAAEGAHELNRVHPVELIGVGHLAGETVLPGKFPFL